MYTTCPKCTRQYRIRAEQLSMASGEVRCGYCGYQFNALGRLSDEPLLLPVTDHDSITSGIRIRHEPDFGGPNSADYKDNDEIQVLDSEFDDEILDAEPQFDIGDIGEGDDESITDRKANDVHDIKLEEVASVKENLVDIPESFLEGKPSSRHLFISLFWGLGAIFLLFTLFAQLSWFNRDEILKNFPELLPKVRIVCDYFNCELLRQRNVHAIKLVNRDVRLHPIYSNTLLVNATITNRSDDVQPFPRIQLTLFNTDGGMVAFREFNPNEYLDDSIIINDGMTPGQPVHFALEVTGPTEGAVSFEFRFL